MSTWNDEVVVDPGEIALSDGRTLTYLEAGDPDGIPVVFLHGLGSSRHAVHPDHSIATDLGIRLLAVDRPGVGGSTRRRGRSVVDWAADMEAVLDHLGVERASVLGWSAGAPHALACAASIPDRLLEVGLVGAAPPLADPDLRPLLSKNWRRIVWVSRWAPQLMVMLFSMSARSLKRNPAALEARSLAELPEPDQNVVEDEEIRQALVKSATEAYWDAGRGVSDDAMALTRNWGFELSEVQVPIRMWHGDQDPSWPLTVAEYLANSLPQADLEVVADAGHLAYLIRWREILSSLAVDRRTK